MPALWADGGLSVPQKPPPKILPGLEIFKGKQGRNLSSSLRWGSGLPSSPSCAGLSTPGDLLLNPIFFTYFVQEITVGKLGKRPGHLLTTYSSFLLLWSMERTDKLGKLLCDLKTWKLYLSQRWVKHGGAWFKVKTKVCLLQRALACQKLLIIQMCVCVLCVHVPVALKT